jgi:ABC-2 type transport system permease protein
VSGVAWAERRRLLVPADVSGRRLLSDRHVLVVGALFYLLVTAILGSLWRAAAGEHGEVAGYTALALTWYIATSEAAVCCIPGRLIEYVGEDIGSGAVSVEMLRPVPVVLVRLAAETGRALTFLACLVGPGFVLARLLGGPPPSAVGVVVAVPSLVLAVLCSVSIQHAIAGSAFWLRDTRATWFLYLKVVYILGGMLMPLEVFPDGLRHVAMALPFMALSYAPARLASGHVEPWLLLVQAGWLVVLFGAAVWVFARGQRRMQEVGG